jgi:formylglycine-generating enzyme required for sulfatase activity
MALAGSRVGPEGGRIIVINRSGSSIVVALMAVLTLGMIMVLPTLSDPVIDASDTPLPSRDQIALEHGRSALVRIEGGSFTRGTWPGEVEQAVRQCIEAGGGCTTGMGADSYPAHIVHLDTFWMETTEVSYGQYVTFLNTLGPRGHLTGCDSQMCVVTQLENNTSAITFDGVGYDTSNPAIDDFPVVNVTWHGASAYCASLGRRLPTEAEWEYAARGGRSSLYPWGDEWNYAAANVRGSINADGVIIAGPSPVGGRVEFASRDGVRDLAGNVAEWVADWYDAGFYGRPQARADNPLGPLTGTERGVRGGSWDDLPFFARAVQRASLAPESYSSSLGFRCVADD